MICGRCATENRDGAKFCRGCGAALVEGCPNCGAAVGAAQPFCDECGTALTGGRPAAAPIPPSAAVEPATERRLVSVLFADLVGFTTLSEGRDSEQVRELQSQYFDTCRRLIELYGGTVEKFIGDAVMAVWGTPTATEDDAERAVRAALDLLAAVTALGDEVGVDDLRARAGVLTGEATVNMGAIGEGMVTGDLVNSAARIQALAGPGQALVGESTRRASEPTIVYEDAGSHELKGKDGLHRLWRAVRVVSGARGALKSEGLEAPFVGRDREWRQVKDLFHACAETRRAHLVSVTGIAGIGKSRLVWEFFKYFDGLPQVTYWHRGRCLSYGEGVTYWALADMVRMRCRIAEDESPESARVKLAEVLDEHVSDQTERAFVEPRVAHLLGPAEGSSFQREELFAAWRVFFERLADVNPVVLAFEDMQWADASLLDFIEHLLEWGRNSPIFVITAARPELIEKRPTWGAGERNFTSVYLEPLSEPAMRALLDGLVPGLPDTLRTQILARAEGVPLYAVETVRMLLDRGLLVQEGSVYRPAGEIDSLEVPETLHALIAARLDGLTAEERQLLQDGAVLGKTFTKPALAAIGDRSEQGLDPLLQSLVRKEVLSIQADPRSPEHGQYGFLQDLVRHVAYETLSRRDRHARHLAAAAYLEQVSPDDDELVEVLASHYADAHAAQPDGDGAEDTRRRAHALLERAGARAESLGAPGQAWRYYEQAGDLTGDDAVRASLLEQAGRMALLAPARDDAERLFNEAVKIHTRAGDTHAAARVKSWIARVERDRGHRERSIELLEGAYASVAGDPPDADSALIAAWLAGGVLFSGALDRADELSEIAIGTGEQLDLPEVLISTWQTKAMIALARGRPQLARGLHRLVLETAFEHGLLSHASTSCINLSDMAFHHDRYGDALEYLDQARSLARRVGHRMREWFADSESSYALFMLGRWEEACAAIAEVPESEGLRSTSSALTGVLEVHVHRGETEAANRLLGLFSEFASTSDLQDLSGYEAGRACLLFAEGRHRDALAAGRSAVAPYPELGIGAQSVKQGFVWAVEAALALGEPETVEELLTGIEQLPPGLRPPYLDAQCRRFRARTAAEPERAVAHFRAAADAFRRIENPFWLAVTQLEHADAVAASGGNGAGKLLDDALTIFESLAATPWIERTRAARRAGEPVG